MFRRSGLALAVLAALAAVPVAFAAYPSPYASQGGEGVMSKDGSLRFVAVGQGGDTVVKAVRRADGTGLSARIPAMTANSNNARTAAIRRFIVAGAGPRQAASGTTRTPRIDLGRCQSR